jgi:multiple antibiotic resistance protein
LYIFNECVKPLKTQKAIFAAMFEASVFLTILIGLFSLINPLSALPIYLGLTQEDTEEYKLKTLRKTCFYILLICLVSYYLGVYLLHFFGITIPALRVAGGLIIFRSGWQLLNVQHKKELRGNIKDEADKKEDISFSPLAMPLLAGPGSMSFLITLYSNRSTDMREALWQDAAAIAAIVIVAVSIYFVFKFAPKLMRYTGQAGLTSLSKVMGFIVTGIGVQMIISSMSTVIKTIFLDLRMP